MCVKIEIEKKTGVVWHIYLSAFNFNIKTLSKKCHIFKKKKINSNTTIVKIFNIMLSCLPNTYNK